MNRYTARPFGVLLLAAGLLLLGVPTQLDVGGDGTDAALSLDLVLAETAFGAALAVIGAMVVVTGIARVRGKLLSPRAALAVPIVATVAAAGAAAWTGVDWETLAAFVVPDALAIALYVALAGGGIAPLVLGAIREDAPALIAGAVVLLSAAALAPAPLLVLGVGVVAGSLAAALLAVVDRGTWRP